MEIFFKDQASLASCRNQECSLGSWAISGDTDRGTQATVLGLCGKQDLTLGASAPRHQGLQQEDGKLALPLGEVL